MPTARIVMRLQRTQAGPCLAALSLLMLWGGVSVVADDEPDWKAWLHKQLLPPDEAATMLDRFVEQALQPLPLPADRVDWLQNRDRLRANALKTLGLDDLLPPQWDLNIQHKGVLRRDGYRIEKLTYESYSGMAVSALVYVPEQATKRAPGIVSITGHTPGEGKAAEYIQRRNVNLVRRGCVVISYDYLGCGERNTGPDALNGQPYGGGNDHGIRTFSFAPRTPTALEILDAVRALDLLVARDDVAPGRLGMTGESGGSNSTYWTAAIDSRVRLAVPVNSVTTFNYWIRTDVNWDWHQRPWGIRRHADIGTLLALHAPSPLVVICSRRGTDDQEFPLDEAEKSVAWAQHVYRLLDAETAINLIESPTDHGYQEDKRQTLYTAVEKWLSPPHPYGAEELPAMIETLDDLRCCLPEGNLTYRDVIAQWIEGLPRVAADPADNEGSRVFLRDRLGYPKPDLEVISESLGSEQRAGLTASFWLIHPERGIRLPAVLIEGADRQSPIVLVPGRDEYGVKRAIDSGRRVLAFDVRGTGEIADGGGRVDNFGWFFGRPRVGMWAFDIRQAARFAAERDAGKPPQVLATNRFGWALLLAAAADASLFGSGKVAVPFERQLELIQQGGDQALADVPGLLERLDVMELKSLWPEGEMVTAQQESPTSGF